MVRSTLSFRKHHTYDVKVGSNPLLPKTSCARTVRIILPAAHAVGNIPFANRALPCNVWECPHYPPAWQGIYPPHRKGDKRQVPGDKCQASGARIFLPIGGQLAGCHVLCCVFSLLKSGAFCSIFLDQVAMKRKTSARSLPSSIGSSNFSSDLSCHVLAVKSPENAAEVHLPPSVRSSRQAHLS